MSKKFKRQNYKIKRVGTSWRKPRGRHSKLRMHIKGKGRHPTPGYRTADSGKHPTGLFEVMVYTLNDLENIDTKTECARIGRTVGARKKSEIMKEAEKKKIKVLNPTINRKTKGDDNDNSQTA